MSRTGGAEASKTLPPGGYGESTETYHLYYFEDAGSSGMDDSPRAPRKGTAGQYFDWIDLCSQMALSFRVLGQIHGVLGHAEHAAHWARRAKELGDVVNAELWCARTRFYHDRMTPTNFVASKTVAGFWPILAGICPEDRLNALVAHLCDVREFNRPTPVPSLSADDPNYSPEGIYWLGGVWASTNYMVVRGLQQAGRGDLAHAIAAKYLNALARTFEAVEPHTLWESYCPERDRPGLTAYTLRPVRPHFVGWTGIGPTAMLIENILGIDLNAAEGSVEWTIRLPSEHGVRQLAVGGGAKADFLCAARPAADAPAAVRLLSSGRALRVRLRCAGRERTVDLESGRETAVTV